MPGRTNPPDGVDDQQGKSNVNKVFSLSVPTRLVEGSIPFQNEHYEQQMSTCVRVSLIRSWKKGNVGKI
jgi:hypothetical protein